MSKTMFDSVEVFVVLKEGFNINESMDKVEKALDREQLQGVMLPFDSGISLFIDEISEDFDYEGYKQKTEAALKESFGDQFIKVEYEDF